MEMIHSGGSFLLTRIPLSSFFVCVLSSKGKDIIIREIIQRQMLKGSKSCDVNIIKVWRVISVE